MMRYKEYSGLRFLRRVFYDLLLKRLLAKAERFLDVGCGRGEFLLSCINNEKICIGVDIDIKQIDKMVKEYINSSGGAIVVADMFHMPFKNDSFHVIFYSHVIEHVSVRDAVKILNSFCKIARIIIIITPSYHRNFWTPGHITPYTMKILNKVMILSGFDPLLVTYDKAFILNLPSQIFENRLIKDFLNNIPISRVKLNLIAIGISRCK
jgi:2-polyprenyl-3-methyl-5-hydroxy-6-metoxy-1,4-benzoquinol methylase